METELHGGCLTQLLETGEDGEKYQMEKNIITIGSDLSCDIRCLELPVQKYCEISYNVNNKAVIRMLSATSVKFPVSLNSNLVDNEGVLLNDGDILTIGDTKMKWEYRPKRPEIRKTIHSISTPTNKACVIKNNPRSDDLLMYKNIISDANTKSDHVQSEVEKRDISTFGTQSTSKIPIRKINCSDKKHNVTVSHVHSGSKIPIVKSNTCSKRLNMTCGDTSNVIEKKKPNLNNKTFVDCNAPRRSTSVKNASIKTPSDKSSPVNISRSKNSGELNLKAVTPKESTNVDKSVLTLPNNLPGRAKSTPYYGEWEDKMCSPLPDTPTVEWKSCTLADFPELPLPEGRCVDLTNEDEPNVSCTEPAIDATVNSILFSPSQELSLNPKVSYFNLDNKSPNVPEVMTTNQSITFLSISKKSEISIDEHSVSKCKRNLMHYISPCTGNASFSSIAIEGTNSDLTTLGYDGRQTNVSIQEPNDTTIETTINKTDLRLSNLRKSTPFKPNNRKRSHYKDSYKFSPVEDEDKSFDNGIIDERFKHVTLRARGKRRRRRSSDVEEDSTRTFSNDLRKSHQISKVIRDLSLIEESPASVLHSSDNASTNLTLVEESRGGVLDSSKNVTKDLSFIEESLVDVLDSSKDVTKDLRLVEESRADILDTSKDVSEQDTLNTTYDIEREEEVLNSTFVIEANDSPIKQPTNTVKKLVSILTPAGPKIQGGKKKSVYFAIPSTPENKCHDTLLNAFQTPNIDTDLFVSPLDNEVTKMANNEVSRQNFDISFSPENTVFSISKNLADNEKLQCSVTSVGSDNIECEELVQRNSSAAEIELSRESSKEQTKHEELIQRNSSTVEIEPSREISKEQTGREESTLRNSNAAENKLSGEMSEEQICENIVNRQNESAGLTINETMMVKKEINRTEEPMINCENYRYKVKHQNGKRKKIHLKKHKRMGYPTNESGIYYLEPPSYLLTSTKAKCVPQINVTHEKHKHKEKVNSQVSVESAATECFIASEVQKNVENSKDGQNNFSESGNSTQKTDQDLLSTPVSNPQIRCTSRSSAKRKLSRTTYKDELFQMEDYLPVNDSLNTPTGSKELQRTETNELSTNKRMSVVPNLTEENIITNSGDIVNKSESLPAELKFDGEESMAFTADMSNVPNKNIDDSSTTSKDMNIESLTMNQAEILNEDNISSSIIEEVLSTPDWGKCALYDSHEKEKSETEEVVKAPEISISQDKEEDKIGNEVKQLVETPKFCNDQHLKESKSAPHYDDLRGVRELLKTPKPISMNYNDLRGVRELLKTPSSPQVPYTRLTGVKRIFAEHKEPTSSYENVSGVKRILHPPKSPDYSAVEGIKELMSPLRSPSKKFESITHKSNIESAGESCTPEQQSTCKEFNKRAIHVIGENTDSLVAEGSENKIILSPTQYLETPPCDSNNDELAEESEMLKNDMEGEKVCDVSSNQNTKPTVSSSLEMCNVEESKRSYLTVVIDEPVSTCTEKESPVVDVVGVEGEQSVVEQQIVITKSPSVKESEPLIPAMESRKSSSVEKAGVTEILHVDKSTTETSLPSEVCVVKTNEHSSDTITQGNKIEITDNVPAEPSQSVKSKKPSAKKRKLHNPIDNNTVAQQTLPVNADERAGTNMSENTNSLHNTEAILAVTTKTRTRKSKQVTSVQICSGNTINEDTQNANHTLAGECNEHPKKPAEKLINLPAEIEQEKIIDKFVVYSPPDMRSKLRSARKCESISIELKVELTDIVMKEKIDSSSYLDANKQLVVPRRILKSAPRTAKKAESTISCSVRESTNLLHETIGATTNSSQNGDTQLSAPTKLAQPKSDVESVQAEKDKLIITSQNVEEKPIAGPSSSICTLVEDHPIVKRIRLPRSAKKCNEIDVNNAETVEELTNGPSEVKRRINPNTASKINEFSNTKKEVKPPVAKAKKSKQSISANVAKEKTNLSRDYEEKIADTSKIENKLSLKQIAVQKPKEKRLSGKVTRNSSTRVLRARRKRSSSIVAGKKVTFNPYKQVRIMTPRTNGRKRSTVKKQAPRDSVVKIATRRKSTARKSLENIKIDVNTGNSSKRRSKATEQINSETAVAGTSNSTKGKVSPKKSPKTASISAKSPTVHVVETNEKDSPKRVTRRTKNIPTFDLDSVMKNEIKIGVKINKNDAAGVSKETITKKENSKRLLKTHLKDIQPTDVTKAGPSGLTRDYAENSRIKKGNSTEINNNEKSNQEILEDEDREEPVKRVTRRMNKISSFEGILEVGNSKVKKVDKKEIKVNVIDKNAFDQNKENVMVRSSSKSMTTSTPALRRSERNRRRN